MTDGTPEAIPVLGAGVVALASLLTVARRA